jgi:hypothetical protein
VAQGEVIAHGFSAFRRRIVGGSLLGIEKTSDGLDRRHGYGTIRIAREPSGRSVILRYFPRRAQRSGGGNWPFSRDSYYYRLKEIDGGTDPAMGLFPVLRTANDLGGNQNLDRALPGRGTHEQVDRVGDHVMTFNHTTKVDNTCIDSLIKRNEIVEINYYKDIAEKMDIIEKRYQSAVEFINQHSRFSEEKLLSGKEEIGADLRSRIEILWERCEKTRDENRSALAILCQRLDRSQVPNDLAVRSVSIFGAFAALRLIRELKEGYDIDASKRDPDPWFPDWKLGRTNLFDLVPQVSRSGRNALGYWYFVIARVGVRPIDDYYNCIIPFEIGRRLLITEVKGDPETYWVWLLPHLLVRGECQFDEILPVDSWTVGRLVGDGFTEWHGSYEPCPWKINTSRVNDLASYLKVSS